MIFGRWRTYFRRSPHPRDVLAAECNLLNLRLDCLCALRLGEPRSDAEGPMRDNFALQSQELALKKFVNGNNEMGESLKKCK